MERLVHTVNAFTADGRNGNPAGVVLDATGLNDTQMQGIAKVVGLSETAFVCTDTQATHRLRFFTPTTEVDLCGHATIATWSLMHQRGMHNAGLYTQQTQAGLLQVSISPNGLVFMEQARARFYEKIPTTAIAPLLGMSQEDFYPDVPPQIVSTGIRDLLVPAMSKSVLARLQPNLEAIAAFSRQHAISGLHVFALLPDGDSIASARNFAPADGIDEEAATGTSNGALLCYLKKYGRLKDQSPYRIEQGESMGKLSYIYGKLVRGTVWIGGEAKVINEASVTI